MSSKHPAIYINVKEEDSGGAAAVSPEAPEPPTHGQNTSLSTFGSGKISNLCEKSGPDGAISNSESASVAGLGCVVDVVVSGCDTSCSDDLLKVYGNYLLTDLVTVHRQHMLQSIKKSSNDLIQNKQETIVTIPKRAARIVDIIKHGPKFSILGEIPYGGGRFFDTAATIDNPTEKKKEIQEITACRELDNDQAQSFVQVLLYEAMAQESSIGNLPLIPDKSEVAVVNPNNTDILLSHRLSNKTLPLDEKGHINHEGNIRFCGLLANKLSECNVRAVPVELRPKLASFVVEKVKSQNKGRFMTKTIKGLLVIADDVTVNEAITFVVWKRFMEMCWLNPNPELPFEVEPSVYLRPQASTVDSNNKLDGNTNSSVKGEPGKWPAEYRLVPPSSASIQLPTDHDVLFGRGGLTNHHPGNKRFRDIIAVHRPDYVAAIKIEKPNVARKIVRAIRCGSPAGRFLKKKPNDGFWYDVGDRHAAEKASQALREKSRKEQYEKTTKQKEKSSGVAQPPFGPYRMGAMLPGGGQQIPQHIPSPGQMTPSQSEMARGLIGPGIQMPRMMTTPCGTTPSGQDLPFHGMIPPNSYMTRQTLPPGHPLALAPYSPQIILTPAAQQNHQTKEICAHIENVEIENKTRNEARLTTSSKDSTDAKRAKHSETLETTNGTLHRNTHGGEIIPTDHDILCGRGGLTNHHLGNRRFRDIVSLHRPDYIQAPKVQKPSVARLIVAAIRNSNPPGRFLRKDPKSGMWFDIGDKPATEKASQALREKTPEERLKNATNHDRPVPSRHYFLPSGASVELPCISGGVIPNTGPGQSGDSPHTGEKLNDELSTAQV